MSAPLEQQISSYVASVKLSRNESQTKELFLVLLAHLFPEKAKQVQKFASGAENFVRYQAAPEGESEYGFIDSFYGNLVIEFEFNLAATGEHAELQLREYVAKLWSAEKQKTDFLCIATDGLEWWIYTPKLNKAGLTSNTFSEANVELFRNEKFVVDRNNPESFYFWLDRVFFRNNSIKPGGEVICAEFGVASFHFTKSFEGLREIFHRALGMKEVQVAFNNWRQYLKYTYGDVDASEDLFIAHSYLSAFTKLLMANVLSSRRKKELQSTQLNAVLTGKFFYDLNIRNYVERDFFYWVNFKEFSDALSKVWMSTFHLLRAYDFTNIDSDFLKDIYQGLVDPEDRHDLGEYYTPDWLCEKILYEAIADRKADGTIPRIADITCGSGSFLRVAIHFIRSKFFDPHDKSQNAADRAIHQITKSVIGFEIHPLAAFIAKTNYMLALEDLLASASEPFNIPIYLCDSLLNSSLDQLKLFEKGFFSVRLADKDFVFPMVEALTDERFDAIIDYIDRITHTFKAGELSEKKVKDLLEREVGKFLITDADEFDVLLESLCKLTIILHQRVLNHENTIWSFVLKNNFRPIAFRNSVDIVVGNPPWLSFRYVESDAYRKELEELGLVRHKIAPQSGKLRTHMELATIFLTHAVDAYLKNGGRLFFVLPRSVFSADHHASFREQSFTLDMRLEEIWDLFPVEPLFRVPSCVVVASRNEKRPCKSFPGRIFSGKLPRQNVNWSAASACLKEEKTTLHLVKMNKRTALSEKDASSQDTDTHYLKKFKQGATILPRNYFFVDTVNDFSGKRIVPVKTCEAIKKNAKKPYKDVSLSGNANTEYLFHTLLAENVVPFGIINPFVIHLPISEVAGKWEYLDSKGMLSEGFLDSSAWFAEVEKSFNELCRTGMTIFETLDYFGKLTVQNPRECYRVLYCTSGKNVCASVFESTDATWIDHTIYWHAPAGGRTEAYYLSAVLNSGSLNEIIKPFQAKGLLGERHIHKKILDVGIPKFSEENEDMMQLASLAEALSQKVRDSIGNFTAKSIGKRRSQIREFYKAEFDEIDNLVMKLFK